MTDETLAAPLRSRRHATSLLSTIEPVAFDAAAGDGVLVIPEATPTPTVIRLERGGIDEAVADRVELRMGGIGRVHATDVSVEWGGIGTARADRVAVDRGSVGAALTGDLQVTQGMARTVLAREAHIEQSYVRTLIAGRVVAERPTGVLVMIARHVSGDIRPVLDWRGALAAGAGLGLVVSLFRVFRRR